MRGLVFFLAFISSLPLIFVSPFNGVLIWYVFSLGNFHTLIWGGPFAALNYAYVIALLTCVSWVFSRADRVQVPLTPLLLMTLLFALWITITSWFALTPGGAAWVKWLEVEKILSMCVVGYALTTTRERVIQLVWAIVLPIGFWGVKGTILSVLRGGAGIHGADGGMLAGNNEFGVGLLMILPLIFYQWQLATNRHLSRALILMLFLVGLGVLLTYSRGALVGACAVGAVFWLRSRAKLATGVLIAAVAVSIYSIAPDAWFTRMSSIQDYQDDGSAQARIWMWKVSLRIAGLHPVTGGGFGITFQPVVTNDMLRGTNLQRMTIPRATHSIYFDVLSEHGWVGLALFAIILVYSGYNCSWLIRRCRDRPDLAWAEALGRAGQAVLVGYATAGAFASLPYLDEYWCVIFIFDAARRLVAWEVAQPANRLATPLWLRPGISPPAVGPSVAVRSVPRLP
jgi:putative inorganic carbon (HCO3(-)) transporter